MRLSDQAWAARIFSWWHGSRVLRRGTGHRFARSNARMRNTQIEFFGNDCEITFGRNVRLFDCSIVVHGTNARLVIGDCVRLRRVRIVVEDQGSRLHIGAYTSMTGATLQAMEGGLVETGADCMLGNGVEVTNSDSHSVIDTTSGQRLNPARDIVLGDRVWLGAGVWVAKGARIGADTVVAARSRVVGTLPANVLAVGSPAVVKRTGISWDRRRLSTPR